MGDAGRQPLQGIAGEFPRAEGKYWLRTGNVPSATGTALRLFMHVRSRWNNAHSKAVRRCLLMSASPGRAAPGREGGAESSAERGRGPRGGGTADESGSEATAEAAGEHAGDDGRGTAGGGRHDETAPSDEGASDARGRPRRTAVRRGARGGRHREGGDRRPRGRRARTPGPGSGGGPSRGATASPDEARHAADTAKTGAPPAGDQRAGGEGGPAETSATAPARPGWPPAPGRCPPSFRAQSGQSRDKVGGAVATRRD